MDGLVYWEYSQILGADFYIKCRKSGGFPLVRSKLASFALIQGWFNYRAHREKPLISHWTQCAPRENLHAPAFSIIIMEDTQGQAGVKAV